MYNKQFNYRQRMAILETYKKAILEQYPKTPNTSGIYILTRKKDNDKCVYVGQSIHILQRIAEHMVDYKGYIDTSLSTHGLKSILNPKGWNLQFIECETSELDCLESKYIDEYKKAGYTVYNKTSGGQGVGKEKIAEYKPAKGYRQGLEQGKKNTVKELNGILKYFDLTLKKDNKLSQRALEKFNKLLGE